MRRLKFLTVLGFVAFAFAGVQQAEAQAYKLGSVEIANAWARPSMGKTGAVYVTLINHGASADKLVSVTSAAAAKVQIHDTKMDGNIMRMRKLDALPLPAGETVHVTPGGLHIMLVGLTKPLTQGETIALHLVFAKAGEIDVSVPVQMKAPMAGDAAMGHMMPDQMHGQMSDHMSGQMHDMGEMPAMRPQP